ncbi:COX6 [Candida pseudojiufengensis]|uniref:COX6 n=1 Tax=Candida pseudojiufengensis TaxID=497109 RepID=UPI0022257363|nr:COX6 [Candida pseudojiufengensis]KAI5964762.1 COX6 [Candida pseudojiufengensis]
MISSTVRLALRSRLAVQTPRISNVMKNSIIKSSFIQHRTYSSAEHKDETFEEFTARYEKEFEEAYDLFEVQRILNNVFSYDLVPAPAVIEKALQACRRVNDYPTAVRTFEALKHKVETPEQYSAYLEELKDIRKELGIDLKEDLYGSSN